MKKTVLVCFFIILPALLFARIGTYVNYGLSTVNPWVGLNAELQVYNFSILAGLGSEGMGLFSGSKTYFGYGLKYYTHDRESSPYFGVERGRCGEVYALDALTSEEYFRKELQSTFVVGGFRWLLNNAFLGDIGHKYVISIGIGFMIIDPYTVPDAPSSGFAPIIQGPGFNVSPMIEITIGDGWFFTPWDKKEDKK